MKILAIIGSYRKGGNTDLIAEQILEGARSRDAHTEKVFIDDLKIASCQGCLECRKAGICRQQDDVAELVKKIEAADGVIFGSPIYGNYITGQAKLLLDRLMGVISKTVFMPGTGPTRVTRLEPKPRNVLILMTIGADRPECADDPLKLLRRMLGSFTNGGMVEELIAAGLMDQGQVTMDIPSLAKVARRLNPVLDAEEQALTMKSKNEAILNKAFRLGVQLTQF